MTEENGLCPPKELGAIYVKLWQKKHLHPYPTAAQIRSPGCRRRSITINYQ